MLHTGLYLGVTNANEGRTDGVLTALEVAGLALDSVDLAVLSGCDTAGTPQGGNGLIGLTSAFQEAGVETIIASLWPADDMATANLMVILYKNLVNGLDYAEALHRTMLEMKDSGAPPRVWASFVAYGMLRKADP